MMQLRYINSFLGELKTQGKNKNGIRFNVCTMDNGCVMRIGLLCPLGQYTSNFIKWLHYYIREGIFEPTEQLFTPTFTIIFYYKNFSNLNYYSSQTL